MKKKRNSTQVENKNAPLARNPLVKTIRDGGSGRLVDDEKDGATWLMMWLNETTN
jgi:hypothetical protein